MYNLLIDDEFIDYLEAMGFRSYPSVQKYCLDLTNGDSCISIHFDTAVFTRIFEGDEARATEYGEVGRVSGIGNLDLIDWQMILHCFDVVPIAEFRRRARMESPNMFQSLKASLQPVAAH